MDYSRERQRVLRNDAYGKYPFARKTKPFKCSGVEILFILITVIELERTILETSICLEVQYYLITLDNAVHRIESIPSKYIHPSLSQR